MCRYSDGSICSLSGLPCESGDAENKHHIYSNATTLAIAPCCELSEKPKVQLVRTELSPNWAIGTIFSPWIPCEKSKQNWLGSSTEPLSYCDRTQMMARLHYRTVLRYFTFTALALFIVLGAGMSTWKHSAGEARQITPAKSSTQLHCKF